MNKLIHACGAAKFTRRYTTQYRRSQGIPGKLGVFRFGFAVAATRVFILFREAMASRRWLQQTRRDG
ncbi:hypothetical protein Y032_0473g2080 [Ancylostoma ceylanicum]|uniref:Uncharacterized protein n=1 Tax=Ancylostoma ceylanicum TaxID=53326 RepID=A0A016WYE2_9BILA|nr:hypothetical protein Y032_0473g2080 [Ancylostoma ceylanicum]